jgi:hypothetical protein
MTTLIVGDIVQTFDIFDEDNKLYLIVKNVHHVYSRPDANGEVHFEKTRYLLQLLNVPYSLETLIDDDQVGTDFYLHKRTYPTGIVHTFHRPNALAKG